MIIDPYKDGIQIFTDSNVTCIRGNDINKICEDLYSRVVCITTNEITGRQSVVQLFDLYIDIGGIGIIYRDTLKAMGLKVFDIKYLKIDYLLPKRVDGIYSSVDKCYKNQRPTFY